MEVPMNTLYQPSPSLLVISLAALALFSACTVSKATKESVARADAKVQQVQQAIGSSEGGAIELQRARDHLQQAHKAVDDGDDKPAQRHASQAELDAELAVAKTQHVTARKAADEMQASIDLLRTESERPSTTR
jgi:hypothetical protein